MVKKTFHAAVLFTVLYVAWLALSGIFSPVFFIYGAISCTLATLLALRMKVVDTEGQPFHLALTAPFYWLWLLKEMLKSGLGVTRVVWSYAYAISPGFAWVSTTQTSDIGHAVFANSITLTPGTVCVNIEKNRIFIHALEQSSIDDLHEGEIDRRVRRMMTGGFSAKTKECA